MSGKRAGKKIAKIRALPNVRGTNNSGGPMNNESRPNINETSSPPLGSELLQTMATEVTDWSAQVSARYARLAEYADSLEQLNEKLEGRVDRSLAMAQVRDFLREKTTLPILKIKY